jgi:hypothetical protein
MKRSNLTLNFRGSEVSLIVIATPDFFPSEDSYREIYLEYHNGWRHAVFCCYPTGSELHEWNEPVRWDDGRLLYVPELAENSIQNAVLYLLENELIERTFEICNKPDEAFANHGVLDEKHQQQYGEKIEQEIRQSIFKVCLLLKSVGNYTTKRELIDEVTKYAVEVVDSEGAN